MAKNFAWSYSALTGFETCARQYHEMRILKAWPDPPGEVQLFGLESHKHIEHRIDMGRALPTHLLHLEPIIQKLETSKGVIRSEYKLALSKEMRPVEFFAASCWVRAVGDVIKIHENRALQMDWKFGRFKEGDGQLKLQSAVLFASHPHIDETSVVYVWAKEKMTTVRNFKRADASAIWQEFLPRVEHMEKAIANKDFPPSPSGLCKKYCRVATCEFYQKGPSR